MKKILLIISIAMLLPFAVLSGCKEINTEAQNVTYTKYVIKNCTIINKPEIYATRRGFHTYVNTKDNFILRYTFIDKKGELQARDIKIIKTGTVYKGQHRWRGYNGAEYIFLPIDDNEAYTLVHSDRWIEDFYLPVDMYSNLFM